jgi:hypothetical protein
MSNVLLFAIGTIVTLLVAGSLVYGALLDGRDRRVRSDAVSEPGHDDHGLRVVDAA